MYWDSVLKAGSYCLFMNLNAKKISLFIWPFNHRNKRTIWIEKILRSNFKWPVMFQFLPNFCYLYLYIRCCIILDFHPWCGHRSEDIDRWKYQRCSLIFICFFFKLEKWNAPNLHSSVCMEAKKTLVNRSWLL